MAEITLVAEAGRPSGSSAARAGCATTAVSPRSCTAPGWRPSPCRWRPETSGPRSARTRASTPCCRSKSRARSSSPWPARLQRHPVRGSVTHVDFQVVDPDREVTAEVTITLTGEALELHRADGVLEQQMFALTIKSRPADIPAHLEVDISDLVIGSAVRVSDIVLPPNVVTEVDPESIVAAGQPPRVQALEEGAAEGEAAEGEAAEGAVAATGEGSAEGGGESGAES